MWYTQRLKGHTVENQVQNQTSTILLYIRYFRSEPTFLFFLELSITINISNINFQAIPLHCSLISEVLHYYCYITELLHYYIGIVTYTQVTAGIEAGL